MKKEYLGKYPRKVDPKNRITIPKLYLEMLDGNRDIVLGEFKGYNKSMLAVFPSREIFDEKVSFYMKMELDLEEIYYKRLVSSYCFNEQIDKAGRIPLKNHIIIPENRKLVFVGSGDLFEIWDEEDYNNYLDNCGPKLVK